jgi:hypothetical protein
VIGTGLSYTLPQYLDMTHATRTAVIEEANNRRR